MDGRRQQTKGQSRHVRNWLRKETGSASVEFAIIAPVFFFLIAFVCEVAYAFTVNANMWDVTRDVARRLAYHQIEAEGATAAAGEYGMLAQNYSVSVAEDDERVTVTISLDFADASLLGLVVRRFPGHMSARISMLREPVL